jgi:hypothetical protein
MHGVKCLNIFFLIILAVINGHAQYKSDCLVLMENTENESGYLSSKGDTIIPFGKYEHCFTSKFCVFAIVSSKDKGIVGINRKEEVLFNVFQFDNGPDPLSNGLFRIIKNGKIGYADNQGKIIIRPQYDCAEPFINGKARVGKGCRMEITGEHTAWTGGNWFTVNRKGQVVTGGSKTKMN